MVWMKSILRLFLIFAVVVFLSPTGASKISATAGFSELIDFQEHIIEQGSSFHGLGESVVIDFDHDMDSDLIRLSSDIDSGYYWHENDGDQNFIPKKLIVGDGDVTKLALGSFAITDVDGDGDYDIIAVSNKGASTTLLAWYENDGSNLAFPVVHEVERTNATLTYSFWSVMSMDFDRDGDIDILTSTYDVQFSGNQDRIILFDNDGNQNFNRKVIVATNGTHAFNFAVDDIDNDGDNDVVSSYFNVNYVGESYLYWYKNNGIFPFASYLVGERGSGAASVDISDLNNDGYKDIIGISCDLIWYEGDNNQTFISHVIEEGSEGCISFSTIGNTASEAKVLTADLDNDDLTDIITSRDVSVPFLGSDKLLVYRNMGNGVFAEKEQIDSGGWGVTTLEPNIGDIDSDGDIDVVGRGNDKLSWFENLTEPQTIDLYGQNLEGVKVGANQLEVNLDVLNGGNSSAQEFKVAFFAIGKNTENIGSSEINNIRKRIGEVIIPSLDAGQTYNISQNFFVKNLDLYQGLGTVIDIDNQITESDETNNSLKVKIRGN